MITLLEQDLCNNPWTLLNKSLGDIELLFIKKVKQDQESLCLINTYYKDGTIRTHSSEYSLAVEQKRYVLLLDNAKYFVTKMGSEVILEKDGVKTHLNKIIS